MTTLLAFLFALTLLIAIHEYGHYRVAVACGVKVLRFSIGFGPVILRHQRTPQSTEFVLSAVPLGGYVRMLDEREGEVAPEDRAMAFNNRPLAARVAIVAAGPLANLLLAVALYAAVNWVGLSQPAAVLAPPVAGSVAEQAGLRGRETVHSVERDGQVRPVETLEGLRWEIVNGVLEGQDLILSARDGQGVERQFRLRTSTIDSKDVSPDLVRQVGITGPWTEPVVGQIRPDSAAARSGLAPDDRVLSVDGRTVTDAVQLRAWIRDSGAAGRTQTQTWEIARSGQVQTIEIKPEVVAEKGKTVGLIGAYLGKMPHMVTPDMGPVESVVKAVEQTADMSWLTLKTLFKMVIGQASLANITGPITIADYAGKSASLGVIPFAVFLALISVSLGVMNLLPLPMLDGGHLMYYLWEGVTGKPVSDLWLDRLQRLGLALLLTLMALALFNDISRIIG
ncbi:MAG: hypothetical protein RL758_380 [Pseudomonadota bacterium]|jgi:regulator of sigma E protease